MCHAISTSMCHSMLASMCHATSTKLTYQDDASCHISIHVSFHNSSCYISPEVVDDRWSGRLNSGSGFVSQQVSPKVGHRINW
jgi:hypothetical protein